MSSTVSDLIGHLRSRLREPSSSVTFDTTHCIDLLQKAADKYAAETDWKWLAATQSVTATSNETDGSVDLPTDFERTVVLLRKGGVHPVSQQVDLGVIDQWDEGYRDPHLVYVHAQDLAADALLVRPKPDVGEVIKHRYLRVETTVTVSTQTFQCPSREEDAIVEYAAHLGFREQGNGDEADRCLAAYKDHVRVNARKNQTDRGPRRVQVRPWA